MKVGRDCDNEDLGIDVIPSESKCKPTGSLRPSDPRKISRRDILKKERLIEDSKLKKQIYIPVTMRISPTTRSICLNSSLIVVNWNVGSSSSFRAGNGAGDHAEADTDADLDDDNSADSMIDIGVVGQVRVRVDDEDDLLESEGCRIPT